MTRVGRAEVRFTDRADGDMGHGGTYVHEVAPDVEARRRRIVDEPWTWLRQVHGTDVVRVSHPAEGAGTRADASVTAADRCVLAVLAADCAPVVLIGDGVVGVAHAGWRGVLAGVLEAGVDALRTAGATRVDALLGPCIHAECYEFGVADLDAVARRLGPAVRALTADGRPALDVPAAVASSLELAAVESFDDLGECTACARDEAGDPKYFSYRARRDTGRQAAVVWQSA